MKEGYKKTEVGVIPEDWEVVKLSDCTEKITDGSHSSPVPVDESNYKICTVANMDGNSLDLNSSANISEEDFNKLIKNGCGPEYGDILLSKDGTIGKTLIYEKINENIVLLSSIAILRPLSNNLSGKYLNQYLRDSRTLARMTNTKTGSAIKRIVLRDIKDLKIALPSLKEQEKIAEILSTVDCQIDDTEKLIEKCSVLKKGLIQRLLTKGIGHSEFKKTEVGEIPVGWEVVNLKDIASRIGDGLHGTPEYNDDGEYYFVNGNNISNGKIMIYDSTKRIGEDEYLKHRRELNNNTILISLNGTIGSLGFYNGEEVVLGKSSGYINLVDNVNKYFIYYQLVNERINRYFMKELTGTTIKNLSLKTLRDTKVVLPTTEEQNKIAQILHGVDNEIEEYKYKKNGLEELKKGLMQQLLTGKIRTI